ncbi:MAG: hypothetical protein V1813_02415 [Candidatus Aenigmatarchaeota archaeon]
MAKKTDLEKAAEGAKFKIPPKKEHEQWPLKTIALFFFILIVPILVSLAGFFLYGVLLFIVGVLYLFVSRRRQSKR